MAAEDGQERNGASWPKTGCAHRVDRPSGDESLEDIQEGLALGSIEEVEQVLADLRSQLREMGIHPQEVYYADFRLNHEERGIERQIYINHEFSDGLWRTKDPKSWARYWREMKADQQRLRELV